MASARHFTAEQAREVGEAIGIDWGIASFGLEQFWAGMEVELEHGEREPSTDVTASDPIVTGKIALAHLNEFPDYYTRLADMEAAAEKQQQDIQTPDPGVPRLTARDVALILGAVGATAGIGAVATTPVLESRWYRRLRKPPWQPPGRTPGTWSVSPRGPEGIDR
jgi:hypothetical protein